MLEIFVTLTNEYFKRNLINIDSTEIVNETEGTEISHQNFYRKLGRNS